MAEIQRPLEERVFALKDRGVSDEEVVKLLISAGYREGEIKAVLDSYVPGSGMSVISLPAPVKEEPDGFSGEDRINPAESPNVPSKTSRKESQKFPKLIGFIETVSRAVALYKARATVLTEIFLIPIAALAVSAIFLNTSNTATGAAHLFWGGISILVYAASFVLFLIGTMAMILAINKKGMGTEEAYWESLKKASSYLWVALLVFLAFLGGLILGVIPAFIFGIWFAFAAYVVLDENQGQKGINALLRSKEYATGYFWVILGRVLLLVAAASVADALIGGVSALFGSLINYMVSVSLQLILVPFSVVFIYSIYSSLKEAKPELISKPATGDRPFFVIMIVLGALAPFFLPSSIVSLLHR